MVTAGDPITAPEAQLDASVFGGDTTYSTGTTVKFSSDLAVNYDYETKVLKVNTVDGKNGSTLEKQNALFTGIKNAYSVVKFTVENKGGTEGDPGMGVRYVDADGKAFRFLTRQTGVRIGEPTWVSNAGLGLTSGFSFANKGTYDVMFVRANDTYYLIAKAHSASEYELMYVSTVATRTAQGVDNTKMPSGEARVSIAFTIGSSPLNVNYEFTNLEASEGEAAVNAIIGATNTITVNGAENVTVAATGATVNAENAKVLDVPFGSDVVVKLTANEGYEITGATDNAGKNFGVGEIKYTRLINDRVITLTVQEVENKTVTGTLSGFTAPTDMDGAGSSYVVFTKENGVKYYGKVTVGETITYTATLPAGNYTKVGWLGFMTDTALTVTADGEQNITLDKVGYTNVTSSGLTVGDDASLTVKNENDTHETAFSDVTFRPATQKLTLQFTLTGMTAVDNAGGYAMTGMFVKDTSGNMFRMTLTGAGDVIMLMLKDDYKSRMRILESDAWTAITTKGVGNARFDQASYNFTIKVIIDGQKFEMYMKNNAENKDWKPIFGADAQFDIVNRYNTGTCDPKNSAGGKDAGSAYVDTIYDVNKDCQFGISIRRDKRDDDSVNKAKFSNIWYTIEDRA